MFAVFAGFAYLACVNLGWALFWDDEALSVFFARNWVEFGVPLADDGRNVYTFHSGGDIAADGTVHYPPLMPALQALSFWLFGAGEIQARAVSAVFSLAGMALFADVLRREFPGRHGFIAVAFALACLSPMTIGYARSATYNGVALFFHVLLFWSYARFCARKHAGYAALMAAAAIASFHAHYLSNLVFVSALAAMHLLFRFDHFTRRDWIVAALAGAVYAAQVIWQYFFVYELAGYGVRAVDWSLGNLKYTFGENRNMLNRNGVLAWSIALWFVAWRAFTTWRAGRDAWRARGDAWRAGGDALRELRDDRALHYLAMIFFGVCALTLTGLQMGVGDVRYFYSFTPFAAVISAAVVCHAWRVFRAAGIALAAALLLTNIAGWPALASYEHDDKPGWTLPLLAFGYHHEHRDALREALGHLRENAAQDDVLYTDHPNPSWLLWYLSDKMRICCRLSRHAPPAIDTRGRAYLFKEDVRRGAPDPDWLLYHLPSAPRSDDLRFRQGGPRYRSSGDFPPWLPASQRPEPQFHLSFPNETVRGGATAIRRLFQMRLYRMVRAE